VRVALLVMVGLFFDGRANAQTSCEYPISDLSQCPPCPASPKCRRQRAEHQPSHNGCGPAKFSSLIENEVIPQGYGAADFATGGCQSPSLCGCNQHDVCYGT